ncbi:MAG: CDC27 family protein [Chryseobacterium sp.]|jgi:tetratricopeptide (TPR) repeat protein|uniref:tetratricopeptide repeat protein n=1 Tax=Chryseobacterium sp. TaxID=1871047 RepID=UPI00282B5A03|nr:CDC27 family protein [Chryseobacterium sp.]MDR2235889.1 CDC27 family protein [Chryseobacterium sp.]
MRLKSVTRYTFFILFTIGSFSAIAQETSQAQLDKARELYESKHYGEASALCEKLLQNDYKNTYLLNQCGLSYFQQGNYEKAKEKFRLATLYCPPGEKENMALYYSNLSASYSHIGDNDKAYENAVKAYQLDNERLWNAASMAQNAGKYEECLKLMNKAGKDNLHIAYWSLYGRCYYHTKRYQEAVESYSYFFSKYDPEDEFVTLNAETEAHYFLYASLYTLASETDENKADAALIRIKKMMDESGTRISSENMMKGFTNADNICNKYGFSGNICTKIFRTWIEHPTAEEELKFTYYTLKDYRKAFQQSEHLMRSDKGMEIKEMNYLSSVQLFLDDYFQNNRKADREKLKSVGGLFKQILDQKISGHPESYRADDDNAALQTFRIFNARFTKKEEQKEAASLLIVIMENLPEGRDKTGVMEILKAGYINN